jgi:hypothetical protein
MHRVTLLSAVTATGSGNGQSMASANKTFQATGTTSAGSGAATIDVQGSLDGTNWDTIGTITLTLGTSSTSGSFTSEDRYQAIRGNVTALSGTSATVYLYAGY